MAVKKANATLGYKCRNPRTKPFKTGSSPSALQRTSAERGVSQHAVTIRGATPPARWGLPGLGLEEDSGNDWRKRGP